MRQVAINAALLLLCSAAVGSAAAQIALPAAAPSVVPGDAGVMGVAFSQLLAHPILLRGTLNGVAIEMQLRLKPGESMALEGSYILAGQKQQILLAGEFEQDALMMEESINGKDVSGLWDGVYDGKTLSGNWSSLEGDVLRPFVLKAIPVK